MNNEVTVEKKINNEWTTIAYYTSLTEALSDGWNLSNPKHLRVRIKR